MGSVLNYLKRKEIKPEAQEIRDKLSQNPFPLFTLCAHEWQIVRHSNQEWIIRGHRKSLSFPWVLAGHFGTMEGTEGWIEFLIAY
jgi:hypothetical protein